MHSSHFFSIVKVIALTAFALFAFAANSLLCRMALGEAQIDAAGFTILRLFSGIVMLMLILQFSAAKSSPSRGSWRSAAYLFIYALGFSFAYLSLDTGTGALILFAAVQLSILLISLWQGQRFQLLEWLGLGCAFAGFVYLVLPGVTAPSLEGFVLMSVAGIAWGLYTLRGKGSTSPLADTAYNFLRTFPMIVVLGMLMFSQISLQPEGILLAIASGAIASGIGYTLWYMALAHLSATEAAVLQLSVPILAAISGVWLLDEALNWRLIIASAMILGGILLVVLGRYQKQKRAV